MGQGKEEACQDIVGVMNIERSRPRVVKYWERPHKIFFAYGGPH